MHFWPTDRSTQASWYLSTLAVASLGELSSLAVMTGSEFLKGALLDTAQEMKRAKDWLISEL